MAIYVNNIQH